MTLTNPPEYLAKTRTAIKELNDYVKKALTPIGLLVLEAAKDDLAVKQVKVFGPKVEGNVSWKLSVKKKAEKKFGFKLEGRPAASTDDAAFKVIAVGELDRGSEKAHRGRGVIGLDLGAYSTVDAGSHATGKLLASFAHAGDGKVVVYRLKEFSADVNAHAAVSAVIYGHKTASGESVVRAATLSDVITTTAAREFMISRLHWMPAVGGRADLLIPNKAPGGAANGDVPANKFFVARSCWNAAEQEGFKSVATCTVGQGVNGCTFDNAGAVASCAASGRDPGENDDKDDTRGEPGAPATADEPPTDLPTF